MGMQAQVYWQWLRHTQLKAQHQGKPLLLISIDEMPIPYHIKPVTGVVKKGFGGQIAVSTKEKRGTASLLATVCNRPSLQRLMPCFLLCNTHRLAVRVRNRLVLLDNFVVWRCKSSWSNGASMMRVVSRINRVCEPYKEFCQPVLLLDTASAHNFALCKGMLFGSRHHSSWHDAAAAGGRRVCLCLCQAAFKSGVSARESDAAASDSARLDPVSSQGPWLASRKVLDGGICSNHWPRRRVLDQSPRSFADFSHYQQSAAYVPAAVFGLATDALWHATLSSTVWRSVC